MKKLPKYLSIIAVSMMVWGAFLVPSDVAHGAVLLQQPNASIEGPATTTAGNLYIRLGQGNLIGLLESIEFYSGFVFSNPAEVVQFIVNGYTNGDYTTGLIDSCSYDIKQPDWGNGTFNQIFETNRVTITTGDCNYSVNSYVEITLFQNTGGARTMWGVPASIPPFNVFGTNYYEVTPYLIFNGTNQSLNPNIINNGNPSGVSTSTIQGYCASSYSTSTGLFSDLTNAVTYGTCTAFAFLFVPNQDTLQDFSDLSSTTRSKIPFSYGYDIAGIFTGMSASSTQNMPVYTIGLGAIDFASSTAMGPIFPNSLEFLSSTTINKFLPPGMHDILYNFAIFAIWAETAFVIYRMVVPRKAKI